MIDKYYPLISLTKIIDKYAYHVIDRSATFPLSHVLKEQIISNKRKLASVICFDG